MTYVILLRGINVGGKNKVPMAELKKYLEELGCQNVTTHINSGNVVLSSNLGKDALRLKIETILPKKFKLDSPVSKVLVISDKAYKAIVDQAPKEFGKDNSRYRYEVIFLMGVSSKEAIEQIVAREAIDKVWQGDQAIYYRRPSLTSPNATKSHLSKVVEKPIYAYLTIRNWNTTTKLLEML